jgi:hypothetical protein
MLVATPPTADVINASATAGTVAIVTVPAGRWLTATVQQCINENLAGTGTASLIYQTTDVQAAPADNSVLARVQLTGLTLTEAAVTSTQEIFVYGGDPNGSGSTIDYVVSGTTSNSIVINGFLI